LGKRWAAQAAKTWVQTTARWLQASTRQVHRMPARKSAVAAAGDWIVGQAMGSAGVRRYRLYRPAGVASGERLPLLVMLHGCGQNATSFAASTRMNGLASRQRFLVLYPEQDRLSHPQACWNWYETRSGRAHAEAASVIQAIDEVVGLYPIDPQRIALAGLSAGAGLAALLATRYAHRFTSVCIHSGVAPGAANSSATALRAMRGQSESAELGGEGALPPLLVIHGSDDRVVSALNAKSAARLWAERMKATPLAVRTVQRGRRHAMQVTDYRWRGRTQVMLCEVQGLGHAWSGGHAGEAHSDPQGPDASRLVYAFAARQWAVVAAPP
jgi:poly(hydroxyalkanoate) depolymerase family esterase